ncbi:MAG: hypothetical protein HZA91_12910 [Verrucomicrobia bacterium]|nr:hypothetical protein [Verrucomicrobiota bacterium]
MSAATRAEAVSAVLRRERPARIVYAPNCWQWFTHHRNHGLLAEPLRHCGGQLELIRHLGLDVFSRNIYCDPTECWFGGLAREVWDGVGVDVKRWTDGEDIVTEKTYFTKGGTLTERLRYIYADSTLVQEKFLLDDYATQVDAFAALVAGRRWRFEPEQYARWQREVGSDGIVNAGELFSPLKLLHFTAGAANAVFLLEDFPERCREILAAHEAAQLDLVGQMLAAGVPAMCSMDNLDTMFHPPHYIERCSAGFYEKASRLCHEAGAVFFIHACGQQRAILPLIASLGVDGLEGVAFPPLGDVQLDEAMRLAGDRLIITGGISAVETEKFASRDEVRRYVEGLFVRLRPYAHRFMLSASCNTSIRTPWRVLEWFRDAWQEFGDLT